MNMSLSEMSVRVALSTIIVLTVIKLTALPSTYLRTQAEHRQHERDLAAQRYEFDKNAQAACDRVADTTLTFILEYDKYVCARWNETRTRRATAYGAR
jgi:hypothetical protein